MLSITAASRFAVRRSLALPAPSSLMAGRPLHSSAPSSSATAATASTTASTANAANTKMSASNHWQFERWLSVALVPACGVPLLLQSPSRVCDFALAVLLPLHCHLGFGQIVTDYLNPRAVGRVGSGAAWAVLYAGTALSAWGLYKFNTSDVGITEFVRNVWRARADRAAAAKKAQ